MAGTNDLLHWRLPVPWSDLHGDEGDLLAFLQRLEAGALDGTEMHEQIRALIMRGNKTEALGIVEPLHHTALTSFI